MISAAPLVSIVMAARDGERFIGAAIDSVLAQSLAEWELIVVDDGSSDDTAASVRRVRDRRVQLHPLGRNLGVAEARNIGFSLARGSLISALDCDDLCRSERLARQVGFLGRNEDVVLVSTSASTLTGTRTRYAPHLRRSSPAMLDWLLRVRNPLVWSSVMMRADALARIGPPMRAERVGAEDFDLYHRIRSHGRIARIDADLVIYRDHADGASKARRQRVVDASVATLAEAYRPLFGETAEARAALMVRHAALCEPVPDGATMAAIGDTLVALRHDLLARTDPGERDVITGAAAASWWRMARTLVAGGRACPPPPPGIGWRGEGLGGAWLRGAGQRLLRLRH